MRETSELRDDVTPEMIAAGVSVFVAWKDANDPSPKSLVTLVFRAMSDAMSDEKKSEMFL